MISETPVKCSISLVRDYTPERKSLVAAKFKGRAKKTTSRQTALPHCNSWVECFLSRRTFQVNVNGTQSQMAEAISGVPQGSVIGPILFVIYVNDLPGRLSADSLLYADDVKLIAPRNRHDLLQSSLNISAS